jgi:hypothetical protein
MKAVEKSRTTRPSGRVSPLLLSPLALPDRVVQMRTL